MWQGTSFRGVGMGWLLCAACVGSISQAGGLVSGQRKAGAREPGLSDTRQAAAGACNVMTFASLVSSLAAPTFWPLHLLPGRGRILR